MLQEPKPVDMDDVFLSPDHYKSHPIQPGLLIMGNGLDFIRGNIIKYVCRSHQQDYTTSLKSLKKARKYLDWLIEKESSVVLTKKTWYGPEELIDGLPEGIKESIRKGGQK